MTTGIILFLMGILNLGFIVNFFSNTVLSAFISAAAVIIVASQFENLLGITVIKSQNFVGIIYNTMLELPNVPWQPVVGSVLCFIILITAKSIKRFPRWIPVELFIMIIGMGLRYFIDLHVPTIGRVPTGFPVPALPVFDGLNPTQLIFQVVLLLLSKYL